MKKPLQPTLTTPPLVEYVAVALGDVRVVGGLAGRVVVGVLGAVGAVMEGEAGAIVPAGGGVWDCGAAGSGAFGLAGAGPRSRDGTIGSPPAGPRGDKQGNQQYSPRVDGGER